MNRTIFGGIAVFFSVLTIAMVGNENTANAGWGCHGGCGGVSSHHRCHGRLFGGRLFGGHRCNGCNGNYGCNGGCYGAGNGGCYGGCNGGCYGGSAGGCNGGYASDCGGYSCNGCGGGGGCHGLFGRRRAHRCHGVNNCRGVSVCPPVCVPACHGAVIEAAPAHAGPPEAPGEPAPEYPAEPAPEYPAEPAPEAAPDVPAAPPSA